MSRNKAFTLIEIIVVLVITAILAVVAIPNYVTMMEQGMANAAMQNALVLAHAQQNYYYNKGNYCVAYTQAASPNICGPAANEVCPSSYNSTCGNGLANLNLSTNLATNITDNNYTYVCQTWSATNTQCFAHRNITFSGVFDGPEIILTLGHPPTVTCATYGGTPTAQHYCPN